MLMLSPENVINHEYQDHSEVNVIIAERPDIRSAIASCIELKADG